MNMFKTNWTEIMKRLEWQVLLFPVLVVLLASVSFLFGGHCAAWQWWTSVLVVLASAWRRKDDWRMSLASNMLFGVVLMAVYVCTRFSVDVFYFDAVGYHMPATRMLIEGWNPYLCATPEAIKEVLGIEPWDMRVLHVLFLSKFVWVFNAVAYFFHHDPLVIMQPMAFYMYFALAITLWRTLGWWHWAWRLGLIFSLRSVCLSGEALVDDVCGASIFTLMVSFVDALKSRQISWLRLLSFSLIACGAKPSGFLACVVMWGVFSVAFFIRERRTWRKWLVQFSFAGLVSAVVLGCFYVSPHYTSYRDFGHPFYPWVSADEQKHPVYDLVYGFHMNNQDYREMSPVAQFANAYLSPTLVQWYYCKKLELDCFVPTCASWGWSPVTGIRNTSPTTLKERFLLLFSVCVLLFFYREMALMTFLALVCAPPYLYGFMRYFKWVDCLHVFAIWTLLRFFYNWLMGGRNMRMWFKVLLAGFVLLWGMSYVAERMMLCAVDIDRKKAARNFKPRKVFCQTHHPDLIEYTTLVTSADKGLASRFRVKTASEVPHSEWGGGYSHRAINSFKLLARQLPNLSSAVVFPLDSSDVPNFAYCPELHIYLESSEHFPELELEKYHINPSRVKRILAYPKYMFKMYLLALGVK